MEFWEGAILIVGGLWLVSRVTKSRPAPINYRQVTGIVPTTTGRVFAALTPPGANGLANPTNTDGSPTLTAGESLLPLGAPIRTASPVIVGPVPVTRAPMLAPISAVRTPRMIEF